MQARVFRQCIKEQRWLPSFPHPSRQIVSTRSVEIISRHCNSIHRIHRVFSVSAIRKNDENTKQHSKHDSNKLNTPLSVDKPKLAIRENIYTWPNLLTTSRILACPVIGWAILHDEFYLSTSLLLYAGLSDWVRCTVAPNGSGTNILSVRWAPGAKIQYALSIGDYP
jgi:hypothetical protein